MRDEWSLSEQSLSRRKVQRAARRRFFVRNELSSACLYFSVFWSVKKLPFGCSSTNTSAEKNLELPSWSPQWELYDSSLCYSLVQMLGKRDETYSVELWRIERNLVGSLIINVVVSRCFLSAVPQQLKESPIRVSEQFRGESVLFRSLVYLIASKSGLQSFS